MNNFYRNSTWVLLLLIASFASLSGNVTWTVQSFNILEGLKAMLMLSLILLVAHLPELVTIGIKERWKRDE